MTESSFNKLRYFWGNFYLITSQTLPSAPSLVLPLNNASVNYSKVTFVWTKAEPNVTRYELDIAKDESFIDVRVDSSIVATGKSQEKVDVYDLEPNTRYWWRVRAYNSEGWGPFSSVRTFETKPLNVEDSFLNGLSPFSIEPNPAVSFIRVKIKEGCWHIIFSDAVVINIYNVLGELCYSQSFSRASFIAQGFVEISLNLDEGLYILQIINGKTIFLSKFIILR